LKLKSNIINELAQQGHEVINLHNIQRYDSNNHCPYSLLNSKWKTIIKTFINFST